MVGSTQVCSLLVRLPSGGRLQRRFQRTWLLEEARHSRKWMKPFVMPICSMHGIFTQYVGDFLGQMLVFHTWSIWHGV
jgi:hypothetical protein